LGQDIWGSNTYYTGQIERNVSAGARLRYELGFTCDLGPGSYGITAALHSGPTHVAGNFDWNENVVVFDDVNQDYPSFIGATRLEHSLRVER
jgi:lipopolysaccharide transport system ATP-binding protein